MRNEKFLYESVPKITRNAIEQPLSHLNEFIKVKKGGLELNIDDIGTDDLPQVLFEF